MQRAIHGQANVLTLPLLKVADGTALTTGTVAMYLRAKDGANAGKWWAGSAWSAAAASAGAGAYKAGADWDISIGSAAWTAGVRYRLYAVDAGGLAFAVGDDVLCERSLAGIGAKADLIGSADLAVTSPVTMTDEIEIVAGDDYLDADGRALTWSDDDWIGPDLTGATIELRLLATSDYDAGTGTATTYAGSVTVVGSAVTITVGLTAAQTAALSGSPPADEVNYHYQLVATLANASIVTLAEGSITVKARVE